MVLVLIFVNVSFCQEKAIFLYNFKMFCSTGLRHGRRCLSKGYNNHCNLLPASIFTFFSFFFSLGDWVGGRAFFRSHYHSIHSLTPTKKAFQEIFSAHSLSFLFLTVERRVVSPWSLWVFFSETWAQEHQFKIDPRQCLFNKKARYSREKKLHWNKNKKKIKDSQADFDEHFVATKNWTKVSAALKWRL